MEKYTFDANIVSDLHKDAYGYRPREWFWSQWNGCGDQGKQEMWDELLADLSDAVAEEKSREAAAIVDVEKRIAEIIDMVDGSTREDAIRFLDDAYDTRGDINFLEYHLGIPYGYLTGRVMGMLQPVCV